jgi:hypothetical protein
MSAGLLYPEINVRIDRVMLQKNQSELFGGPGCLPGPFRISNWAMISWQKSP